MQHTLGEGWPVPRRGIPIAPERRLREIVPASCWSLLDAEALITAASSAEAREALLEWQPHLPTYVLNRCAFCVACARALGTCLSSGGTGSSGGLAGDWCWCARLV